MGIMGHTGATRASAKKQNDICKAHKGLLIDLACGLPRSAIDHMRKPAATVIAEANSHKPKADLETALLKDRSKSRAVIAAMIKVPMAV
jgi:hypothetical protein